MTSSKSNSSPKIVYFLGAGASYNAVPILNKQAFSMIKVADLIQNATRKIRQAKGPKTRNLDHLFELSARMRNFGNYALEYGSIDIYARRLYLLKDYDELNKLKYCLSVYFDIWENFLYSSDHVEESRFFDRIDKRYLGLLAVMLKENDFHPKLSESVSFISWNYDLQLEMAYESFMGTEKNSLLSINQNFNFMGTSKKSDKPDVIHLNGYRGFIKSEDEFHPIINREEGAKLDDYLNGLLDFDQKFVPFLSIGFKTQINYAWENNSESLESAKKIMNEADILVIIGYSFPSFNREIDTILIKEFQNNNGKKIIYQDPGANQDLVNSIFRNPKEVDVKKDTPHQFHIPHEFLFPEDGEIDFYGIPSSS